MKVGDRNESINFGWMEVVSEPYDSGTKRKDMKVDVRFDNTGEVRKGVLTKNFKLGAVRDGSVAFSPVVGMRMKSNSHGYATIEKVVSLREVVLRFENTGEVTTFQWDAITVGMFQDKFIKQLVSDRLRQEEERRAVAWAEELERREHNRVRSEEAQKERDALAKIRLIEREERRIRSAAFRKQREEAEETYARNMEEVLKPSKVSLNIRRPSKGVLDVDFKDRDGKWVLRFKIDGEFIQTRLGKLHNVLTQRTKAGGSYQELSPSYVGVGLSDRFKDGQDFCEWAVTQQGWGLGYALDKDLLSSGVREYSPENCCFLPPVINTSIVKTATSKQTFISKSKVGYRLSFRVNDKQLVFRNIESEDECLRIYRKFREGYVKRLATEYRGGISERAYDALMSWECKI